MRKVLLIPLALAASLQIAAGGPAVLHLPQDRLEAPVLFGSRIVSVNRPLGKVFAPGQRNPFPVLMRFQPDSAGNMVLWPEGRPKEGFRGHGPKGGRGRDRHIHPVHFPLLTDRTADTLAFDVSGYFSAYPDQVSAIPPKMLQEDFLRASDIVSVKETPEYLQITGKYSYASGLEVTAACYLLFLPEKPMPVRTVDPEKAGYNAVEHRDRGSRQDQPSQRWDLDRRTHIDFYVDKAFPTEWYPYIKEGIEDWNRAFERIGRGAVLRVRPEPADGSLDRTSPLVNMVRYIDVDEPNAKGDVLCDPRSGEILQADILWWKRAETLLQDWRYVQTGAADPRARLRDCPMDMLGPMIRHSICHETGHALGLCHNMGASFSYPSDSLRSPSFTQRYGTAASVMDYARFNHLATAGDVAAGVGLLPPRVGPYDLYAIACGYAAEEPEPDRYCAYAPAITAAIPPDPSAQPETLGDDLLASSAAGLGNCRALLTLDGLDDHRLGLLRKQYYRYLTLALSNIGGAVRGTPVPWRKQKETLAFVLRGLAAVPSELADPAAEKRIQDELEGHFLPERIQQTCGEKALKRYFRTLRRLRNRYKTHYPTIY